MSVTIDRVLKNIDADFETTLHDLKELVKIPSVSFAGFPPSALRESAKAVAAHLQSYGFNQVTFLEVPGAPPAVYGEVLVSPDKPTLLLYAHHDVQPAGDESAWISPPFLPEIRNGRLYGRGTADDKGGIFIHTAAVKAWLKGGGELPVNVKIIIEGEEETGSAHLAQLLNEYKTLLQADVIVLTDTSNFDTGVPSITASLRGLVVLDVEVKTLENAVHSGFWGGVVPDPAMALAKMLATLVDDNGQIVVPDLCAGMIPLLDHEEQALQTLSAGAKTIRQQAGILPEVDLLVPATQVYQSLWRRPSLIVNAIQASSKKDARNIICDKAWARVGVRIVPGMNPQQVVEALKKHLDQMAPWGVHISYSVETASPAWSTATDHPVFKQALQALHQGYQKEPVIMGCGASIPFVRPFSEKLGGIPALLIGVEDPYSNAHGENESLHLEDWRRAIHSAAILYGKLGNGS